MFKETSGILQTMGITGPTLVIDETRARRNIRTMADKAGRCGVGFRPHFKTHQSGLVGRWFADAGCDRITVSSVTMAERFADTGWTDITLAFLLNRHELPRLARLARHLRTRGGKLGVTIDSAEAARTLADEPDFPAEVWLKIDTGYGRTGLPWQQDEAIAAVAAAIPAGLAPAGLLTHAGHSYRARSPRELQRIWIETRDRLAAVRRALGRPELTLSVGDTPTCSVVGDLCGVDEIRPGNFVFYDLMQLEIGSCSPADLAAAVACPVVGVYPGRRQAVIFGGAVHLSKESLAGDQGRLCWGRLGTMAPGGRGLGGIPAGTELVSLSQEHGVVELAGDLPAGGAFPLAVGDLVLVWPVHSCLAADLLGPDGRVKVIPAP